MQSVAGARCVARADGIGEEGTSILLTELGK